MTCRVLFEILVINRGKTERIQKYGFRYHSRRIFRKVPASLERGVVPVLIDGRLVGLVLEVRGVELGVVGWLVMTGDSGWNGRWVWRDDCGIPKSAEIAKKNRRPMTTVVFNRQLNSRIYSWRSTGVRKIGKKSIKCCGATNESTGWFNWKSRYFTYSL